MSRRRRRLWGVPRRSNTKHEFFSRLLGFRPKSDSTHHKKLLLSVFEKPVQPFAEFISEAVDGLVGR